ncbi:MAG: glycosyltransferase 87 family protein [Gordonia sp. (in: high G+C Gram-positive bacteria)]
MRRILASVAALIVAGLAVWIGNLLVPYTTPFWGLFDNGLDLEVYRGGAQAFWSGGALYELKYAGPMDYTYAPISVVVLTPFTWVSLPVAQIVWTAGILVALYLIVMRSFGALGRPASWPLRALAVALVAVAMLLEPVRTTIWFGQINIFLLLVILADLLRDAGASAATGERQARLTGWGTGVAAGIKLTPLIFVLYFALLRRWRTMTGVLGGFVLTVAIGFAAMPHAAWDYWTDKSHDARRVGLPDTVGNQSLRGMIANLAETDQPSPVLWLVLVAGALTLGMGAAVVAHRRGHELLALGIVGLTSCAVSPMSWGHHWVWVVPVLVICVDAVLRTDLSWPRRGAAGAGAVVLVAVTFSWVTHVDHEIWYINATYPEGYFLGLFFEHGPEWARWFVVYPYNAVFLGTTLATLAVLWRPRVRRWFRSPRTAV